MYQPSEKILRSEKLRRHYGISMFVDVKPTREHLSRLKGAPCYMSNRRISELSGLCESNLCQIIRGKRGAGRGYELVDEIHRDTEAALLGVRPEIDCPERGGGHVPPTGARRRLQALICQGFPMRFISEAMGWGTDPQPVHRLVTGKAGKGFVFHSTHRKACELYDKVSNVKPEDMGFDKIAIGRAKGSARRNGYVPSHVWDSDTIDDPDAIPEWTGECGTVQGRRLHARYGIPVCPACEEADDNHGTGPGGFSAEKLRALRKEKGINRRDLSRAMGCHDTAISHWESGRSTPREDSIQKMVRALDCTVEDLTE